MVKKYEIEDLTVVTATNKIVYDSEEAFIHQVVDDEDYHIEAITCAARPVEFSIVNRLSHLDNELVERACETTNAKKEITILTNDDYHLILTPFPEKFTFFGEEQAYKLTNAVIDECIVLGVKSLRVTQYCMMRGVMPFYDQFKGVLKAFTERKDSTVELVYFDIPETKAYELNKLFSSYERNHAKQ